MLCGGAVHVLTLTLALCAGHDVRAEAHIPREYGVKLCGREFIRAVIFTCGGSRWRRSMEAVLWRDKTMDTSFHTRSLLSPRAPSSSSYSLEDLLSIRRQQWDTSYLSHILGVLAAEDQPSSSSSCRKRHHFSVGVAGTCCSQGCTKNDIGLLC
ncbi:prorelaxin H1 [Dunckerocampus dactyliophorus]|uniref:prorelaxin H1 n=1 Tax=Dunckerocampus dactyliophorus TaxID=161453 RepID=UPI0024065890|nr:prorelaxin H1 [Dunckerocampus dactyliophorus]